MIDIRKKENESASSMMFRFTKKFSKAASCAKLNAGVFMPEKKVN